MPLIPNEKSAFTYPTQSPGSTSTENLSPCTGSKELLWKVRVHAQPLQPCLTLCNPAGCSPPGSSVHGDSPDENTGEGCHALLQVILPTQRSNLRLLCLLHWQLGFFTTEPPGKPPLIL